MSTHTTTRSGRTPPARSAAPACRTMRDGESIQGTDPGPARRLTFSMTSAACGTSTTRSTMEAGLSSRGLG